jgi:hypothetical protein
MVYGIEHAFDTLACGGYGWTAIPKAVTIELVIYPA